jgi:NADH-quinone oxidoreductase subunit E
MSPVKAGSPVSASSAEANSAETGSCVDALLAEIGERSRDQLIPLLQEIQVREGYLSQAAMTKLAAALDTPVASVYGVATFYNQFRFAPLGMHVIELCRGTACHVKQSLALQQHLQRRLRLRPDGNSADKRFTVLKVACLGACSIAPVIKLDGEFYGHLTVDKLDVLLDSFEEDDEGQTSASGGRATLGTAPAGANGAAEEVAA